MTADALSRVVVHDFDGLQVNVKREETVQMKAEVCVQCAEAHCTLFSQFGRPMGLTKYYNRASPFESLQNQCAPSCLHENQNEWRVEAGFYL